MTLLPPAERLDEIPRFLEDPLRVENLVYALHWRDVADLGYALSWDTLQLVRCLRFPKKAALTFQQHPGRFCAAHGFFPSWAEFAVRTFFLATDHAANDVKNQ